MAHRLPPAGMSTAESDVFRFNQVFEDPRKKKCICSLRPKCGCCTSASAHECTTGDGSRLPRKFVCVRKQMPVYQCVVVGDADQEDCRPRSPLTNPGLLDCPLTPQCPQKQRGDTDTFIHQTVNENISLGGCRKGPKRTICPKIPRAQVGISKSILQPQPCVCCHQIKRPAVCVYKRELPKPCNVQETKAPTAVKVTRYCGNQDLECGKQVLIEILDGC